MLTHFEGILGFPVEVGQIFVIGGRIIDGASKLEVILTKSKEENASIPLQITINSIDDVIERNSRLDGIGWGKAEIQDNLQDSKIINPLLPGENFQFYILVGDGKFHITVNGFPYCTYAFRTPLEDIRAIIVQKDVQFITQIDHRQSYPFPHPIVQHDNPIFVFSNDVPNAFKIGHVVIVTGIAYGNPKGMFLIRFTEAENLEKQCLHFNPRFENKVVVRTHAIGDGTFGREERGGGFPFNFEEQFKLAIAFTSSCFKFGVNGKFFSDFKYRTPNAVKLANGLKCSTRNGMHLEVTGVDHIQMADSSCEGFEKYSHPDADL